jgi:hypothetical protein
MKTLKSRPYLHFDNPLKAEKLSSFSISAEEVAKHAFYPLLGFSKTNRRIDFSINPPKAVTKNRDIRYASHKDSAIYSRYSEALGEKYEEFASSHGIDGCILAYRAEIGFNVTFARDLFQEIRSRRNCYVICLDISGFFDNLDHKIVRDRVIDVLGVKKLGHDWRNIINSVTRYAYVDKKEAEKALGKKSVGRVCPPKLFRSKIRPIINVNKLDYGIPQGTPISGLLANIYLWKFDRLISNYLKSIGGSYRRYSDDIAIVLPSAAYRDAAMQAINIGLMEHFLFVKDSKTCETTFSDATGKIESSGDHLQYLGFLFDGNRILIRHQSLKNFYARMRRNIRIYVRSAARSGIPKTELRRRVLVGRFTHWGDAKNFVQYAYRASREMNAPEIKKQLRRHVKIFKKQWETAVTKYY